jgi:hypothetical protein
MRGSRDERCSVEETKRGRSAAQKVVAGMVGMGRASGYGPDIVPGRFVVYTRHAARRWEVIVEPDEGLQLLVVVTAYPVG